MINVCLIKLLVSVADLGMMMIITFMISAYSGIFRDLYPL